MTGLDWIDLSRSSLTDHQVADFLAWLRKSSSRNSLGGIVLANNQLTAVPEGLGSFKNLSLLDLFGNRIQHIRSRSLVFSSSVPVTTVDLRSCGLKDIEPGAFQGDFRNAYVYLNGNNLSRLEAPVFKPLLQQMIQTDRPEDDAAGLSLDGSTFFKMKYSAGYLFN